MNSTQLFDFQTGLSRTIKKIELFSDAIVPTKKVFKQLADEMSRSRNKLDFINESLLEGKRPDLSRFNFFNMRGLCIDVGVFTSHIQSGTYGAIFRDRDKF